MSDEPRPALRRLDPDRARGPGPGDSGDAEPDGEAGAGAAPATGAGPEPGTGPGAEPGTLPEPPAVDTRRYRRMIGLFGLALVIVASVYQFATNGVASTGVAPGQRLHWFAAPLAPTNLVGDPNLHPPCTEARHDPRALNICLIAARQPLVVAFFVIGSTECENQVDALQTLSARYPSIAFAAVAVNAGRAETAALVRSHGWTIPVAYDRDGSIGGLYGVAICPMAELARRGGVVSDRLIGDKWQSLAAIEPRVAALARDGG